MPIKVSDLAIAPVKGLRLAQADQLDIQASGAVGDRTGDGWQVPPVLCRRGSSGCSGRSEFEPD